MLSLLDKCKKCADRLADFYDIAIVFFTTFL
jgi:hypothetical protein